MPRYSNILQFIQLSFVRSVVTMYVIASFLIWDQLTYRLMHSPPRFVNYIFRFKLLSATIGNKNSLSPSVRKDFTFCKNCECCPGSRNIKWSLIRVLHIYVISVPKLWRHKQHFVLSHIKPYNDMFLKIQGTKDLKSYILDFCKNCKCCPGSRNIRWSLIHVLNCHIYVCLKRLFKIKPTPMPVVNGKRGHEGRIPVQLIATKSK